MLYSAAIDPNLQNIKQSKDGCILKFLLSGAINNLVSRELEDIQSTIAFIRTMFVRVIWRQL